MIGYGVIARRLYNDPKTVREGNKYFKWILEYVGEGYTKAMAVGRGKYPLFRQNIPDWTAELVESHAVLQSPSRVEELVKIFIHATKVWQLPTHTAFGTITQTLVDGDRILGNGSRAIMLLMGKL